MRKQPDRFVIRKAVLFHFSHRFSTLWFHLFPIGYSLPLPLCMGISDLR